jgi:hypothetical protein
MHFINAKLLEGFLSLQAKHAGIGTYVLPIASLMLGLTADASGQTPAREIREAVPLAPLTNEPAAKLVVNPPVPDQLAAGRVVLQYRTENLRILPVYGSAALKVSPRVGHLHITVDDGPWRWVDASNQPIIINKLPPGPHHILIEMADPTHQVIDGKRIEFTIPVPKEATAPR